MYFGTRKEFTLFPPSSRMPPVAMMVIYAYATSISAPVLIHSNSHYQAKLTAEPQGINQPEHDLKRIIL